MRPETFLIGVALVALIIGFAAVDLARRAQRTKTVEPKRDGGCHAGQEHDWLNWTEPAPITRKVAASFMGGELIDQEILVQTRKCTRCNLSQRAMA